MNAVLNAGRYFCRKRRARSGLKIDIDKCDGMEGSAFMEQCFRRALVNSNKDKRELVVPDFRMKVKSHSKSDHAI